MRVRRRIAASERKKEDYFQALVDEGATPPSEPREGITKDRISDVLKVINKDTTDLVDVVFALLDNQFPNLFDSTAPFSDGASTADIACYVGIFIRHGNKLDREGRDYWIKPLSDVGIVELVTYAKGKGFIPGHLTAKSPSSAYRLTKEFIELLETKSKDAHKKYFDGNEIARRLKAQADAYEYSLSLHGHGDHHRLISMASSVYASQFLPSFRIIYTDDSDGSRISDEEKALLEEHGISLTLSDAFPDLILIDDKDNLWFIEAVTSDGEVDEHKLKALESFCSRNKKNLAGATTCYLNWKSAASRQERFKNIGKNSYLWIASDPSKHFLAKSIPS